MTYTNKVARRATLAGSALAVSALMLAACGSAPEESTSSSSDSSDDAAAASDFLPCMVSDQGGFDDKSFNQLGYEGLVEAGENLGVEPVSVESKDESEYQPNIDSLVDQGCNLIITVGYLLAPAAGEAAAANPDVEFVSIDDMVDNDGDGETDSDNIKPLVYDTAQSAFLAGYASAAYSTTGKVGTFGGMNIPTVTVFMDGFAQGVDYYNEQKSADVEVIGWNRDSQDGSFTGAFEANQDAINTAQGIVDQGVDVLFPVGGPIYQSAASVIEGSDSDIALIGADADIFETDPTTEDIAFTSVLKDMKVSVDDVVEAAAGGDFDGTAYVGTLENDGVGIAPFHNFEDKLPDGLTDELDTIKAGIIDGSIPVESYLSE